MSTWAQMEAARKEKYPEISRGDMLIKKGNEPVDCVRVRLEHTRNCPRVKINEPKDVVNLMREMKSYDREHAIIIALDNKNAVVSIENISTGSLDASIVHPREAIKGSLLANAAHIIFVHNHPSGDPMPSAEDISIERKLRGAFDTVGINMIDSIIVGRDSYYSSKERGTFEYDFTEEHNIMERNDACDMAVTAALEIIRERCGDKYSK